MADEIMLCLPVFIECAIMIFFEIVVNRFVVFEIRSVLLFLPFGHEKVAKPLTKRKTTEQQGSAREKKGETFRSRYLSGGRRPFAQFVFGVVSNDFDKDF